MAFQGTTAISHDTTLELPLPRLAEGRFSSCAAFTDEALFDQLGVRIAFLERCGGTSAPPFDSLNLGVNVADDEAALAANRACVREAFGVPDACIIQPEQVHGADVITCTSLEDARVIAAGPRPKVDAFVVDCAHVMALLAFADCVPLIFVAPTGAFSVVHAGWRGVLAGVWKSALAALERESGMQASTFNVYIGPCIHACHFETGADVVASFVDAFGPTCLADASHVDLRRALTSGLEALGVVGERIADVDICTVCDAGERFFSYRATDGACGRQGALAVRMA